MEITYAKYNGFLLPNLLLPTEETPVYGKYGRLRLEYLKEHHRATYVTLLTSGQLTHHLNEVDREANEILGLLIEQIAQAHGITEQLKAQDQLTWVGAMNNISSTAEEIIQAELLFV